MKTRSSLLARWRQQVRRLKQEALVLYLAYRDPRVPWYARLLVALIVAYALSPIDLIPDFIPILGYLDDLILIPLGLALTIRLIPPPVLADCRIATAALLAQGKPVSRLGAALVITLWLLSLLLTILLLTRILR